MTKRLVIAALVVLAVLAMAGGFWFSRWQRADRQTPEQLRAQIAALEAERAQLRDRFEERVRSEPRLQGMPETPVRIGIPTELARDLIQRTLRGVVDQVTLELKNLRVRKSGRVRKVITIGDYDLEVRIKRVIGTLRPGDATVTFGGNRLALAMPVTVADGTGNAALTFKWDGRNISGAVCGDMEVTLDVGGGVAPRTYPVAGALQLTATASEILAAPVLPPLRINLKVVPSDAAWAAAQKILDDKGGLCGFVVDRVDIMGLVHRLIDRGFNVRIPTEKVRPVALPVGIEPTMTVRGQPVALGIKVGGLAITEHAIWLGAHVTVTTGEEAVKAAEEATVAPKTRPRIVPKKKAPATPARKTAAAATG